MFNISALTEEKRQEFFEFFEVVPSMIGACLHTNLKEIAEIGIHKAAPTGSFRYKGTLLMVDRNTNYSDQEGTITVNINFNNKAFDLTGSTSTYAVSGSGYVDTSFGKLSSSNSIAIVSGIYQNASINGSLHGADASGVSGLIYTSGSTPRYTGAFAGATR